MADWSLFAGYVARKEVGADGVCRTVYQHREIMAALVGRPLRSSEHVHHLDERRSNNDPSNLEILSPGEHARRHMATGLTMVDLVCVACGGTFRRAAHQERGHRAKGKRGPFCGKRCAGRFSRAEQIANGLTNLRKGAK